MSWLTAILPGLWVLALAALLAWALRRWFDPVPARCWAAWGIVLAVLFGAVLFGGRVMLPLGYLTKVPPFTRLVRESRRATCSRATSCSRSPPGWCGCARPTAPGSGRSGTPSSGAGEPLLANPQSQAFQPLVWLALPFPVAPGFGVIAALAGAARPGLHLAAAAAAGDLGDSRPWRAASPSASPDSSSSRSDGPSPARRPSCRCCSMAWPSWTSAERGGTACSWLSPRRQCCWSAIPRPACTSRRWRRLSPCRACSPGRRGSGSRWCGPGRLAAAIGAALAAPVALPAAEYLPQSLRVSILEARPRRLLAGRRSPAQAERSRRQHGGAARLAPTPVAQRRAATPSATTASAPTGGTATSTRTPPASPARPPCSPPSPASGRWRRTPLPPGTADAGGGPGLPGDPGAPPGLAADLRARCRCSATP